MPVQHFHILGLPRLGMPAEQVIVVLAEFTRPIMVANVVEIGLRQRGMNQAENQQKGLQPAERFKPRFPQIVRHEAIKPNLESHSSNIQGFPQLIAYPSILCRSFDLVKSHDFRPTLPSATHARWVTPKAPREIRAHDRLGWKVKHATTRSSPLHSHRGGNALSPG